MTAVLEPFTAASFDLTDSRECDVVMKGGITSGVIYPLAVCELAQHYRLRSIGGASAGAIAAAVAAAAEYGRQTGATSSAPLAAASAPDGPLPPGFLGLAALPGRLGQERSGRSLLMRLFRPQPEARRLFEVITGGLDEFAQLRARSVKPVHAVRVVARLLRRTAGQMIVRGVVGVSPGVLITVVGLVAAFAATTPLGVLAALLLVIIGLAVAVAGLAIAMVTGVLADLRRLPHVGFGITSGRGSSDADLALTPWLHDRLQELAGLDRDAPPLDFGMLRAHQIELQVMTTNLSRLEPMSMPWTSYTYFYAEAEFEALFGPRVVAALAGAAPLPPSDLRDRQRWDSLVAFAAARGLRPMPPADQLPVIVAVRMSLSFPVLIAAVPLHAPDETTQAYAAYREFVEQWWVEHPDGTVEQLLRDCERGAGPAPQFAVNWFSDGGLTSNLPVHFFDGPLPTRPTFAIDLSEFSRDHPRSVAEAENSYLRTDTGLPQRRTRDFLFSAATGTLRPRSSVGQLLSFAVALVETARTWVDEEALAMPGYRDRVVTVYQGGGEGGLNLSMPPTVVARLSERGRWAARKLVQQFAPDAQGWPNQRWIRFRATTSALAEWLGAFDVKYAAPVEPSFDELLRDPPSYPIEGDADEVRERLDGLRAEIDRWELVRDELLRGRPQQPPVLRLTAPTGPDRTAPVNADPALTP